MNPSRFYGTSKHVNPIPGDGCQSDDDLVSDSDPEYEPASVPSRRTRKKKLSYLNRIVPMMMKSPHKACMLHPHPQLRAKKTKKSR